MIKKYHEFIKESISNIAENVIGDILDFKYQKMCHIYSDKSQSDNYTTEVTNWENSYYKKDEEISSIFLTSNNILSDELKWYEENSTLEFLNEYDFNKISELGKGIELVTFVGDDNIEEYYNLFNGKCDYIWAQYFTDSEKIDFSKAIAKTSYNNREIVIVTKYILK